MRKKNFKMHRGLFPTAENRNLWEETENMVLVLVLKGLSGFRAVK